MEDSKDKLSKKQRSLNMSKVKQKNTKPELLVRSILHGKGFRFRINVTDLPGKPDIVLPKYRTVVLVHGCYWHRHNCSRGQSIPTKNREFWQAKFDQNVQRDILVKNRLNVMGYQVLTIWECELKKDRIDQTIDKLAKRIRR